VARFNVITKADVEQVLAVLKDKPADRAIELFGELFS